MQLPRWLTTLIVFSLVVAAFVVSFLVGKRMLMTPRKETSMMSELPPPVSVEVYQETPTPTVSMEAVVKPEVKTPAVVKGRTYTVQVGLFSKKSNAWNERARLRKMGYKAMVVKKGKYYRVQLGSYRSSAAASNAASSLKKKGIEAISVRY